MLTSRPNRRRSVGRAAVLLASLVGPPCCFAAAAPPDVLLFGGRQCVWAGHYLAGLPPESPSLCFAVRLADGPRQTFQRPRQVGTLRGRLTAAAVRGESLHVIYADGTHYRYDPAGGTVARTLPDGAVPLAMAGDDSRAALYALVPTEVASALEASPPVTADGPTSSRLAVVRYEQGAWHRDRPAPDALGPDDSCWFAAEEGTCHLIVADERSSERLAYFQSSDDGWADPLYVAVPIAETVLAAVILEGRMTLVVAGADADPRLLPLDDGESTSGTALAGGRGAVAAAMCGKQLALAFPGDGRAPRIGLWSADGQPVRDGPAAIQALLPVHQPWVTIGMPYTAYGVLAAILAPVFVWRREVMTVPTVLPRGQALASYTRRLLAFGLDCLFWLPVVVWLMAPLLPPAGSSTPDEVDVARLTMSAAFLLRWLIAAGGFACYAAIFEAATGATPGKRICRCRVADEHGRRCGVGRVLARNLLRVIELFPIFQLMPAIVLVLLTRNRQRLGDLVAGTIVVEDTGSEARDVTDNGDESLPS